MPNQLDILNEDERIFQAWGSVEVVDREGDVIPMSEFSKIMPTLMDRGGDLMDSHSNRKIGKILNYTFKEHPETGKEGLLLTGKVYRNYQLDDQIWSDVKTGKMQGLSFGGANKNHKPTMSYKDWDGMKPADVLKDLEGYEFSIVEEPCNQFANFTSINTLAKSEVKKPFANYTSFDNCVKANQDKNNPEAYCAAIHEQATGKWPSEKTKQYWTESNGGSKMEKQDEVLPVEAPAEDNNLEARIAALEEKIVLLEQQLAPVEASKEEDDEEEEKPEEEVEKQEGNGGDVGTTPVNPSGEGGNVTLPESIEEKIEDDTGIEPKTDAITVMEKELNTIKKQLENLTRKVTSTSSTITPRTIAKKRAPVEDITPSQKVLKSMREGKILDMKQVRRMAADAIKKRYNEALDKEGGI